MLSKKKYLIWTASFIFLAVAGLVFVKVVKKLQTRTAEAKKSEQRAENKKLKQNADPAPTDSGAVQENLTDQNFSVPSQVQQIKNKYPVHQNITTTFFWAGEEAGQDNKNISNLPSAWDEKWVSHFGGVDDPKKRNGIFPAKFIPKENPFYFALPYNDFDSKGKRKQEVYSLIPWANEKNWGKSDSVCKNRWIKIMKNGKAAYAQWQDVGPFKENDAAYVFGSAAPKSKANKNAGLDVSPAVKDYLGLLDIDKTDWQFVDSSAVPDGPWKKVVTTSQCYWN